ncbi:MAG: DUF615 domain-containing protein [Gammaproteobacteria bacterium]|nr:DUF615 domain-containing protein [Gammaproteobacteria bacterium]
MENDANPDESDDIECVSKSQLKRESQAVHKLGKRLTELSTDQLATIPLDEPVLEAIALAHKIQNKRSALKRHFLFLAKLLRARDTETILAAVESFDISSHIQIQRHHQAERWRDEILQHGFDAIELFVVDQPNADRQTLRQLWRNYTHAKNDSRKLQQARQIYKNIKYLLDVNAVQVTANHDQTVSPE